MDFERLDLEEYGFKGFVTVSELNLGRLKEIPDIGGVYVVLREKSIPVKFLKESIGGYFKNENPTVSIKTLQKNWVQDAGVIYIGLASGKSKYSTLRARITTYLRFSRGKKAGHRGGKMIWQIDNSDDLLMAWKPLKNENPDYIETELISQFRSKYGERPFANLTK